MVGDGTGSGGRGAGRSPGGRAVARAGAAPYDRPVSELARQIEPDMDAAGLRVAVVVARYNPAVTDRLLEGAAAEFARLGGEAGSLEVLPAPGAFELPVLARAAIDRGVDAVVALGCLIRGETRHDAVIADAVAGALAGLSAETGVPIGFGLLTVTTAEQAAARSQPVVESGRAGAAPDGVEKGVVSNKGVEAMAAAVHVATVLRRLRSPGAQSGSGERVPGATRTRQEPEA